MTALDLATVSGVACGSLPGPPAFATWTLGGRGAGRGERGVELMRRLTKHLREERPEKVFIEEPMNIRTMVKIGATADTQIFLSGVVYLAETVCAAHGVPTATVTRQAVLMHFLGHAPAAKQAKAACMARCKLLRWSPSNTDESDAAALWDYGCAHARPGLFMQAAGDRPALSRRG